jgi:hypothetical protein
VIHKRTTVPKLLGTLTGTVARIERLIVPSVPSHLTPLFMQVSALFGVTVPSVPGRADRARHTPAHTVPVCPDPKEGHVGTLPSRLTQRESR